MGEQVPRGFWVAAREEPERVALVDAAGRAWTAGELLAGANQLVHALRARGVQPFDPVATLTRNSAELFQVLLAVFQGGWQYVPLNTHLTAAELAYILGDSGAAALFADAELADVARAAADQADVPTDGRIAIGGDIPGFARFDDVLADQPDSIPDDRVAGQFMQYTSGTTGRPKAVQRDLPSFDPETWVAAYSANLTRYDIEPGGDAVHLVTSPMYHLSPLNFGYFSLHLEHTVVLMEKWDAERALQLIDEHGVTDVAMVPTQLHRLMALPEDVAREVRRLVAPAGHPRCRAVSGRAQAAVVRVARSGDLRVLRRVGGRGHAGATRRVARASRHRRPTLGRCRREGARRRRQRGAHGHRRHRLPEAHGRFRVQGRSREDRGQPPRRLLHGRRHGRARRRGLPLPARPQDRHGRVRRREHLPG